MIPFNKPPYTGSEDQYVLDVMHTEKMCGDGQYTKKCKEWFEREVGCISALLTPSCTAALEMAAMLIDIKPGDEVIMPSYTFVSTANAFVIRGAKIVFVDIRPDTMNINEQLIEQAITPKTKAIVPVHYAGVACEMDLIMQIAERHNLIVIEDAAQGMMSTYKGRKLGTIGHLGAYSFHETKNYTSGGEGGLLLVNDQRFKQRAEIIREKGTNRSQFIRGNVDKYTWVDIGSSYLPGELQAAYLWGQLQSVDAIMQDRLRTWHYYYNAFSDLADVVLPNIPLSCSHNAHMFYLKLLDLNTRNRLIDYLKSKGVSAVFHYIPLHTAPAGLSHGVFSGEDIYTTVESQRLVRLPIYYGISEAYKNEIVKAVRSFFDNI